MGPASARPTRESGSSAALPAVFRRGGQGAHPTATHASFDVHESPLMVVAPGGPGWIDHLYPFQRASGPCDHTATQATVDVHDTDPSPNPGQRVGFGASQTDQADPRAGSGVAGERTIVIAQTSAPSHRSAFAALVPDIRSGRILVIIVFAHVWS
jgi:hypothetical protein